MYFKRSIAVIAAALLSACGGGGGGDGSGATAPAADVSITAVGPAGPVPSGSTTRIGLTVSNAGLGPAANLVIRPNLSQQLARNGVITCVASGSAVCPSLVGESLDVPALPPGGSLTFQIEVILGEQVSGFVSSSSTVSADNDGSPGNNMAVSLVNAYWADVSVSGSGPGTAVAAGDTARYTMTVANAGPDAARNVAIRNWPDAGQLLETMTCSASGGAVCPAALGPQMTVPVLPTAGSLQFSVAATVPAGTSGGIGNSMVATLAGDPRIADNRAVVKARAHFSAPATGNVVELQSDAGDYIGQGASYTYTQYNAALSVRATGGRIMVEVHGDQHWFADFVLPGALTQVQPGTYANLGRSPFNDPAAGGIDWHGDGRGCNTIQGAFVVDSAAYVNGELTAVSLSFEQHCEGMTQALRGQIRWSTGDTTVPPGPRNPAPLVLWAPAAGTTPASGSYVYLESDTDDYIGQGATATYTRASADLSVTVSGGNVKIKVDGNEHWNGEFQAMSSVSQLQAGYYGNLLRHPFHNPARGGIGWWGEGRGCNEEAGWFVVDTVTHVNGVLSTLDLRFEKHCENGVPALRGRVHWDANDTTLPPGPVAPPSGLWAPAAGSTPATGNYVHLVSDPGDFVGQGRTLTYTPANSVVTLQASGARLAVSIAGTETFFGDFQGMSSLTRLEPGYYANLQRYPFNNPTAGGLSWSGSGGCNTLTGWFVIDSISYSNGVITAVELRFEQHCGGQVPALRGKIRWGQ